MLIPQVFLHTSLHSSSTNSQSCPVAMDRLQQLDRKVDPIRSMDRGQAFDLKRRGVGYRVADGALYRPRDRFHQELLAANQGLGLSRALCSISHQVEIPLAVGAVRSRVLFRGWAWAREAQEPHHRARPLQAPCLELG